MNVIDLNPAAIQARPGNRAAGGVNEDRIKELATSIRKHGILNPLLIRRVVRSEGDGWELIAGHRRLAAANVAGLTKVPCSVVEVSDDQVGEIEQIAIIENLQREDLHPLDESDGYQALVDLGMAKRDIGAAVGRHRNHVADRLLLQNLIPDARQSWIDHGGLSVGAARQLAQLTAPLQAECVKKAQKHRPDLRNLGPHAISDFAHTKSDLLRDAPFSTRSKTLVPEAGACNQCPKRFGYQTDLFDDSQSSDQRCGDRKCWKGKVRAHVAAARAKLEKKGIEYTDITTHYEDRRGAVSMQRVTFAGDLSPEQQANRKTKPTVMLWADGPKIGTMTDGWIKPARKARDWQAEQATEREAKEARIAERLPLLAELIATVTAADQAVSDAACTSAAVLDRVCGEVGTWSAQLAMARIAGATPNEYGHVEDRKLTDAAEVELGNMHPARRLLILLAARDLDGELVGRATDMLTTIRDLLAAANGAATPAPAPAPADDGDEAAARDLVDAGGIAATDAESEGAE